MKFHWLLLLPVLLCPQINLHLDKIQCIKFTSYSIETEDDLVDIGWLQTGLVYSDKHLSPGIVLFGVGTRYDQKGSVIDEDDYLVVRHRHSSKKRKK